jgi:leader peptidase (prepilin peptidase)/N-methyltransferase
MTMELTAIRPMRVRQALLTSLLVAGGVLALGLAIGDSPGVYRKLMLTLGIAALAWIAAWDCRTLRAPNRFVYPAAAIATIAPFALGSHTGLMALAGASLAFSLLLAAVILGRGAMGYGDAKVAYICGALVGASAVVPMLLATFVLGFVLAGSALALRLATRKDALAFTPFLYLGVLLVVVFANHSIYVTGR